MGRYFLDARRTSRSVWSIANSDAYTDTNSNTDADWRVTEQYSRSAGD